MQDATSSPPTGPAEPALSMGESGLIAASLRAGLHGFKRFWVVLTMACAIVVIASVPTQWVSASMTRTLTRAVATTDAARASGGGGAAALDADESLALLGDMGSACCGLCFSLLYTVLLQAPLYCGLFVLGARASAGRARLGQLACGFRRYGATMLVGVLTLLIGGGGAVVVLLLGQFSLGLLAAKLASGFLSGSVLLVMAAALLVATFWLSVRLWFASLRVADPDRPRLSAMGAVSWSWNATDGARQWGLMPLALLLVAAVLVVGLLAALLASAVAGVTATSASAHASATAADAQETQALLIGGALSALATLLVMPPLLAIAGAAYEIVAAKVEPISLDSQGGLQLPAEHSDQESGGMA